jgi:HSP20 family protein
MELTRRQPLDRFRWRISDLFDESLGRSPGNAGSATSVWSPAVDVLESADSYLIRVELPGIAKQDFNLQVNQGVLTLAGERTLKPPASGFEYRSVERSTGKFTRSFYLPQTVKRDEIQATYRDGILEIYVPKSEYSKARQITVTVN